MVRALLTFIVAMAAPPQPGLYHKQLEKFGLPNVNVFFRVGVNDASPNEGWMKMLSQGVKAWGRTVEPLRCWGSGEETTWTYDPTNGTVTLLEGCMVEAMDKGGMDLRTSVYSDVGVPSLTIEGLSVFDTATWERLCMTEEQIDLALSPDCCDIKSWLWDNVEDEANELKGEHEYCPKVTQLGSPTELIGPDHALNSCQSFASSPFGKKCVGEEKVEYFEATTNTWEQCEQKCAEYASQNGPGCCVNEVDEDFGGCAYFVGGSEATEEWSNSKSKSIQCKDYTPVVDTNAQEYHGNCIFPFDPFFLDDSERLDVAKHGEVWGKSTCLSECTRIGGINGKKLRACEWNQKTEVCTRIIGNLYASILTGTTPSRDTPIVCMPDYDEAVVDTNAQEYHGNCIFPYDPFFLDDSERLDVAKRGKVWGKSTCLSECKRIGEINDEKLQACEWNQKTKKCRRVIGSSAVRLTGTTPSRHTSIVCMAVTAVTCTDNDAAACPECTGSNNNAVCAAQDSSFSGTCTGSNKCTVLPCPTGFTAAEGEAEILSLQFAQLETCATLCEDDETCISFLHGSTTNHCAFSNATQPNRPKSQGYQMCIIDEVTITTTTAHRHLTSRLRQP